MFAQSFSVGRQPFSYDFFLWRVKVLYIYINHVDKLTQKQNVKKLCKSLHKRKLKTLTGTPQRNVS